MKNNVCMCINFLFFVHSFVRSFRMSTETQDTEEQGNYMEMEYLYISRSLSICLRVYVERFRMPNAVRRMHVYAAVAIAVDVAVVAIRILNV